MTAPDMPWPNKLRISSKELKSWSVIVIGIAFWANIVIATNGDSGDAIAAMLNRILENGAFDVFAWIMIAVGCIQLHDDRPASGRAILAALLAAALVLVPGRLATAAALTLVAGIVFAGAPAAASARPTRLVLAALAAEALWMSWPLAGLHVLVGTVDAGIVTHLLRALGQAAYQHGNVVENVSGSFSIAVWPYCSSSLPLASVCLAFVVITFYRGHALRRAHLPWLAASLLASVALTELRLVLMAWDAGAYAWWHSGPGVSVYAVAALAVTAVAPMLAPPGVPPGGADGSRGTMREQAA